MLQFLIKNKIYCVLILNNYENDSIQKFNSKFIFNDIKTLISYKYDFNLSPNMKINKFNEYQAVRDVSSRTV
jgi:hypothetical protein